VPCGASADGCTVTAAAGTQRLSEVSSHTHFWWVPISASLYGEHSLSRASGMVKTYHQRLSYCHHLAHFHQTRCHYPAKAQSTPRNRVQAQTGFRPPGWLQPVAVPLVIGLGLIQCRLAVIYFCSNNCTERSELAWPGSALLRLHHWAWLPANACSVSTLVYTQMIWPLLTVSPRHQKFTYLHAGRKSVPIQSHCLTASTMPSTL